MKDRLAALMKQTDSSSTAVASSKRPAGDDGELTLCRTVPPFKKRKISAQGKATATTTPSRSEEQALERLPSATKRQQEDERDERAESPRDADAPVVHQPLSSMTEGKATTEAAHAMMHMCRVAPTDSAAPAGPTKAEPKAVPPAAAAKVPTVADSEAVKAANRMRLPDKLMEYLNKKVAKKTLWWMPDGVSFALDTSTAQNELLDPYFMGTKLSSFLRSLNRWGFKRIFYHSLPKNTFSFHHHMFSRGDPALELEMKMYSREPVPERSVPPPGESKPKAAAPKAAHKKKKKKKKKSKPAAAKKTPVVIAPSPPVPCPAADATATAATSSTREPAPAAAATAAAAPSAGVAPPPQAFLEALLRAGNANTAAAAAPNDPPVAVPMAAPQPPQVVTMSPQALLETLLRPGSASSSQQQQQQQQIPEQIIVRQQQPLPPANVLAQDPQSVLEELLRGQQRQQPSPELSIQHQLQLLVAQQQQQQQQQQSGQLQTLLQHALQSAAVREQNQQLVQLVMLLTSALRR